MQDFCAFFLKNVCLTHKKAVSLHRICMNKRILHILEWCIAILAYAYLIYKLVTYDQYDSLALSLRSMTISQWIAIGLCVALMPLNLFFEAWKWQTLWNRDRSSDTLSMNISDAHRQIYYSKLAGLITPYHIGEYPARAMLMPEGSLPRILSLGAVAGTTTTASIIIIGALSLPFLPAVYATLGDNYIYLLIGIIAALILALILSPKLLRRWTDVSHITIQISLGQSVLRLFCWYLQLALILYALCPFNFQLSPFNFLLLPVYYLLISVTPNVPVVEAGVRGAWAMFLFGSVNAAIAGVLLWAINTLLPCLCWLFIRKRA